MFKPLPKDFLLNKYGIKVRLASKDDAPYIMSLRTDKQLARFIHQTEDDFQAHYRWFDKYKKREEEGRDYYFIYLKDEKPVGLNRIYNIYEYYGTIGSWLCSPDNEVEVSMLTNILLHDIVFEILDLDIVLFDVRRANMHVWKMHKSLGATIVGESDIDYYLVNSRTSYQPLRDKMLSMLYIK